MDIILASWYTFLIFFTIGLIELIDSITLLNEIGECSCRISIHKQI